MLSYLLCHVFGFLLVQYATTPKNAFTNHKSQSAAKDIF